MGENRTRTYTREDEPFERVREIEDEIPTQEERLFAMMRNAQTISEDRWDRESQRRKEMPFMKRRHVIASVEDEEAAGSEQEKPDDGEEPFRRVPSFGDED